MSEAGERHELQAPEPSSMEPAQVRMAILALSGLVFLLVAVVIYLLPSRGAHGPSALASLNAFLNSCSIVCLVAGYFFIRQKNIRLHRRAMLAAFGLSAMFLISYLIHHAQVGSVPFAGQGPIRIVYFGLLIPHIFLSAAVVPLALLTIYRGWTERIDHHRRIARITLPLWLFVSVSGVAVYFMLYHMGY